MADKLVLKVIAANKPRGTITVQWNGDPNHEYTYKIPVDSYRVPLKGRPLWIFLISKFLKDVAPSSEHAALRASFLAEEAKREESYQYRQLYDLVGREEDVTPLVKPEPRPKV